MADLPAEAHLTEAKEEAPPVAIEAPSVDSEFEGVQLWQETEDEKLRRQSEDEHERAVWKKLKSHAPLDGRRHICVWGIFQALMNQGIDCALAADTALKLEGLVFSIKMGYRDLTMFRLYQEEILAIASALHVNKLLAESCVESYSKMLAVTRMSGAERFAYGHE